MSVVYTTAGGSRFHDDRACWALATGRGNAAYRAGEGAYGESWYGAGRLDGMYPVAAIPSKQAARAGFTACRVCVPPALALPPTGRTYGHEPVRGFLADCAGERLVCARCEVRVGRSYLDEWGDVHSWMSHSAVLWPCTSAVVLGLVPRCPDCGWGIDVPDGRKCQSCEHSDQLDAWGTAL